MPTLDDLIGKINSIPSLLEQFIPAELERTAQDLIALQVTKIRREGIGQYSTRKYPAWYLNGKQINQQGTEFLRKHGVLTKGSTKQPRSKRLQNKYSGLTNWSEFRAAQGLQNAFVDATYTTRTLNQLGTGNKANTLIKYQISIMGVTDYSKKVFGALHARYGEFFSPSQQIRDQLGKATAIRVGNYLGSALGAKVNVSVI